MNLRGRSGINYCEERVLKVLINDKKKLYLPSTSSKDDIYINAEDFENFAGLNRVFKRIVYEPERVFRYK